MARNKAQAEAAVEETSGGLSFDDGIVLTTTVLLVAACVLAFMAMGHYPG